jgi:hypothetical protein
MLEVGREQFAEGHLFAHNAPLRRWILTASNQAVQFCGAVASLVDAQVRPRTNADALGTASNLPIKDEGLFSRRRNGESQAAGCKS